jgi:hypothetical protein
MEREATRQRTRHREAFLSMVKTNLRTLLEINTMKAPNATRKIDSIGPVNKNNKINTSRVLKRQKSQNYPKQ